MIYPPTPYILPLQDEGSEGEAPFAARNTDGLATRRGCEAQERYILAYPLLNSVLIPSQDTGALQDHGPGRGEAPAAGNVCPCVRFCSNPYPPLPLQDEALQN